MTSQPSEDGPQNFERQVRFWAVVVLIATISSLAFRSPLIAQEANSVEARLNANKDATVSALRAKALSSLQRGDSTSAIAAADAMVRLAPDDPRTTRLAADIYLRCGKAKWAVRLFDRYLQSNSSEMPHLWQRGIALYLIGDFKGGAEQFEEHQKVNPNDVENAAWHFLCVSKLDSPDEAKKRVLAAPNDRRVPMEEVRRMLITGDTAAVTSRVMETPENSEARKMAAFYGDFYLGLYADALGERDKARSFLKRAAEDAPRNYMGDVARVYADWVSEGDLE